MLQERLTNLSMIAIESELLNSLDLNEIIKEFASIKSRKVNFN